MDFMTQLLGFVDGLVIPELSFLGVLVEGLYNFVGNYGWTVVIFTVILKVIMLPVDFWQRYSMKKSSAKMASMQPMVDKIEKTYANDKTKADQEKMKIYKKQGYSAFSSCLPMILTMVIFIVMFGGLTSYSTHVNVKDYVEINKFYRDTYSTEYSQNIADGKTAEDAHSQALEKAKLEVGKFYISETKEGFLWIKNIWRSDTWTEPFPTYQEFTKGGLGVAGVGTDFVNEGEYNIIREAVLAADPGYKLIGDAGWNGLLILPVLSIALSFFSTKLTNTTTTKKDKKDKKSATQDPTEATAKTMTIIMPIMMGVFAVLYTAAFSIYMVTNSILSVLSSLAINPIVDKMVAKKMLKDNPQVSYRR